MTITIVNTREYDNFAEFAAALDRLVSSGRLPIRRIIAVAPHALAARYARARAIPLRIIKPLYTRFRGAARAEHRDRLVAASTHLVAFWDKQSRGTGQVI